jgi:hypothetical protein
VNAVRPEGGAVEAVNVNAVEATSRATRCSAGGRAGIAARMRSSIIGIAPVSSALMA